MVGDAAIQVDDCGALRCAAEHSVDRYGVLQDEGSHDSYPRVTNE